VSPSRGKAANVTSYIRGFSDNAREVFIERFKFPEHIQKLDEANLLYQVVCRFAEVDLHPEAVPNHVMGSIFEELIRRFSEQSNETAGEHFTPREVIRLMVNLLFMEDHDVLTRPGIVKTLYDPACGTGGMLSVAEEYLRELTPDAALKVFGQELNDESFAICESDMMIKGQDPDNIKRGNSFDNDGHIGMTFDYMLSNPPFGVEWKKVEKAVRDEADTQGYAGRFGAGLPRINDGSFLFLQHMIAKMKPAQEGGSRIAIVFNGSPLFTGDAGAGESEIRRWIIENDWLEAIVGLPEQLFYNTGINTYIWIVTNKKPTERRGKIQLINATSFFEKMRQSLGNKRNYLTDAHIAEITRIYGDFRLGPYSKIFDNDDFGYRRIVVERPLKLNFQASPERIVRLREEKTFQSLASSKKRGQAGEMEAELGRKLQAQILAMLQTLDATKVWTSRDAFQTALHAVARQSGLKEWIGLIPQHWNVQLAKRLEKHAGDLAQTGPFGAQLHASDYVDEGVPLILIKHVDGNRIHDDNMPRIVPERAAELDRYRVMPGDIVFSRVGSVGRIGLVTEEQAGWLISGQMLRLRFQSKEVLPSFLMHAISSDAVLTYFDLHVVGTTRDSINTESLSAMPLPLPSLPEQRAIADFLDRKTKAIDDLVQKKERLIELLQEKRQTLITEAVTKGIDPNIPMKDSGIEWLGEIPAHWEVAALKRFADVEYGVGGELDRTLTEGIPIISLPNVTIDGRLHLDGLSLRPLSSVEKRQALLRRGDLLFNWRNGSVDHIGKTAIFDNDGEFTHVSFLLRVRLDPIRAVPDFYWLVLNGLRATDFFASSKFQVNVTYNQSELRRVRLPLPPKEEQLSIARHVLDQTKRIDSATDTMTVSIGRLCEYRQALISAAVTGKIDVTTGRRHAGS